MEYKCIKSFIKDGYKRYDYGNEISSYEFNNLSYEHQRHFEEINDLTDNLIDLGNSMLTSSLFDNSDNNTNTSNDSGGFDSFGGGDFGGGGAGSDW